MKEVNISFYQDNKNFIVENEKEDLEFVSKLINNELKFQNKIYF